MASYLSPRTQGSHHMDIGVKATNALITLYSSSLVDLVSELKEF